MKKVTKKLLYFIVGLALIGLYCEYIIYYIVIAQCNWPTLTNAKNREVLKAFILADTHLLGPFKGHWLDKLRREWQMHQAFQSIINIHSPDVVFVLGLQPQPYRQTTQPLCRVCSKSTGMLLARNPTVILEIYIGDLFDEGEWTTDHQFKDYVNRFHSLFALPQHIRMFVTVGNHDIGFHNRIRRNSLQRFINRLNSPLVQHVILKSNHFVLINSMAMEGDSCNMCAEAQKQISIISDKLIKCSENVNNCAFNFSQPILMQHFPLYRKSDAICTEPDAPPLPERNKLFRLKIDALSKEATEYLISKIQPRAAFGGHTHHGCLVKHSHKNNEFLEYSVPSFSWRNRPDPKFMLVSITPDEYAVNKCGLPMEMTLIGSAVIMFLFLIFYIFTLRKIGK